MKIKVQRMDSASWAALQGVVGASALGVLVAVARAVWYCVQTANHKRVRSNCCGRKLEVSMDVGPTPVAVLEAAAVASAHAAAAALPSPESVEEGLGVDKVREKAAATLRPSIRIPPEDSEKPTPLSSDGLPLPGKIARLLFGI